MNESILKLAKETGALIGNNLEAFYRAAYNKAISDAARVIAPYKCYDAQIDIRRLEMK